MVRVDPDFADEFPDADAASTEATATLMVTVDLILGHLENRIEHLLQVSQTAGQTLAVIDGAGEPLTPSEIGNRVLVSSATMTSTLDTLEHRGWIRRMPNPEDRRSLLIEITDEGKVAADRLLPGVHALEREAMAGLTPAERTQLVKLLGKVLERANQIPPEPAEPITAVRNRPTRLG